MAKNYIIKRGTQITYIKDTHYYFYAQNKANIVNDEEYFLVNKIYNKDGVWRIQLVHKTKHYIFNAFVDDIGSKIITNNISFGKYYVTPCRNSKHFLDEKYNCLLIEKNPSAPKTVVSSNTTLIFEGDTNFSDYFANNISNYSFDILNNINDKDNSNEIDIKLDDLEKENNKPLINVKEEIINANDKVETNNSEDFFNIEGKALDNEQIESSKYIGNQLVIAGAGAGKTLSIVGKVKYLLEKEKVDPKEILVLAFTDKVVSELKERISRISNKNIDILTFHKLGLKVFKAVRDYREIDLETIYKYLRKIMFSNMLLENKELASLIYHFVNRDYENTDLVDNDTISKLLSSVSKVTNNGEKVQSVNALIACNLLKENNIDYHYHIVNKFYHYLVIEDKYYVQFTNSSYYKNGLNLAKIGFEEIPCHLYDYLDDLGYKISERKGYRAFLSSPFIAKNYEHLFEDLNEAYHIICSSGSYNDDLDHLIDNFCKNNKRATMFINIFKLIRKEIANLLQETYKTDFSYMIIGPSEILKHEKCMPYKYIIVDEYQDISPARYNLVKELINQNNGYLMAYGDDWQSIYAFAGSSNKFFMDFSKLLPNAKEFKLRNTYRNSQELISASTDFVNLNPIQKEKEINSTKSLKTPIITLNYKVSNLDSLMFTLDYINKKHPNNKTKLMVLGRTNHSIDSFKDIPDLEQIDTDENGNGIYIHDSYPHINIVFLTIHRSKGLEADYVLVTALHNKMMPLTISKEKEYLNILNKLNEYEEEKKHEKYEGLPSSEERRLFYVALTRTKNNVFLSIPKDMRHIKKSIFIDDLYKQNSQYIESYDIDSLYEIPLEHRCPYCGGLITSISKKGRIYNFCENKCKIR